MDRDHFQFNCVIFEYEFQKYHAVWISSYHGVNIPVL